MVLNSGVEWTPGELVTQSCRLAFTPSNTAEPEAWQVLWGLLSTKPLGPLCASLAAGCSLTSCVLAEVPA